MDVATIQGLITTLGFPIVLVGALLWFGYKVYNDSKVDSQKREERHYEMMGKFQASLNGFSEILNKYDLKLSVIEDKIDKIEEKVGK